MFQIEEFAKKLKWLRTQKGITQTALAQRLQISPQSVSKWECAQTLPDLENLCLIANILGVTTDELLQSTTDCRKRMLGIDGGGSKTEFVLFTEEGTVLERLILGDCNPNAIGIEESAALLCRGIRSLEEAHGLICGIFVGASGFLTGGNGEKIKKILERACPKAKIRCETDILNVIAAGTDTQNCIAAICGTGSVVYAKEREKLTRLTGWGYLLSNGGSGYDIGRDGLRAALADAEGFGEKTRITQLVQARIEAPVSVCIREAYRHDQSYVASFAPLVVEAYAQGDAVAGEILKRNARALADTINYTAKRYPCGDRVIVSGGLLTGCQVYCQMVTEALTPGLQLQIPQVPQVLGACRLCTELCGVDVRKIDSKLISQYYERG